MALSTVIERMSTGSAAISRRSIARRLTEARDHGTKCFDDFQGKVGLRPPRLRLLEVLGDGGPCIVILRK